MASGWDSRRWPLSQPRLAGRGPKREAGRKPFGVTWWGAAWINALEHRARLDRNRLPRGRSYARSGQVEQVEVQPGEVRCLVQGSRVEPYAVRVQVRTFEPAEWDRVIDALVAQAGHAAALLDGELLPEVAGDVRQAGVDLLPGPGDLRPRCTCPDWADLCKHAAAACYLLADELDRDPFVLFVLRGRTREELMAALRARRRGPATSKPLELPDGGQTERSVPASLAWARSTEPLPSLPAPPRRAGMPTVLAVDPPAGSAIHTEALRLLAADAAARAWELVAGERTTPFDENPEQDVARRAAASLGESPSRRAVAELAARAGTPARDLLHRALAWRYGGRAGLETLLRPWDPNPEDLQAARVALGPGAAARRNRVTRGARQLRLGPDGRWYPYRKAGAVWVPDGPPPEHLETTVSEKG